MICQGDNHDLVVIDRDSGGDLTARKVDLFVLLLLFPVSGGDLHLGDELDIHFDYYKSAVDYRTDDHKLARRPDVWSGAAVLFIRLAGRLGELPEARRTPKPRRYALSEPVLERTDGHRRRLSTLGAPTRQDRPLPADPGVRRGVGQSNARSETSRADLQREPLPG